MLKLKNSVKIYVFFLRSPFLAFGTSTRLVDIWDYKDCPQSSVDSSGWNIPNIMKPYLTEAILHSIER